MSDAELLRQGMDRLHNEISLLRAELQGGVVGVICKLGGTNYYLQQIHEDLCLLLKYHANPPME